MSYTKKSILFSTLTFLQATKKLIFDYEYELVIDQSGFGFLEEAL